MFWQPKMSKYFSFKVDKTRHTAFYVETNSQWKGWVIGCNQGAHDDSWYESYFPPLQIFIL